MSPWKSKRGSSDLVEKAEKLAARRDSRTKWSEADQENAIAQAKQTSDDPHKLQRLRSAFAMFDLDGGGSIEASELHVLLEGLGIKMSREEALDLVHEVTRSMSLWPLRRVGATTPNGSACACSGGRRWQRCGRI